MDLLKQELLRKRQSLAADTGGKRVFKRSDIEQKNIQKLREQEKRELEAKVQLQTTAATAAAAGTNKSNSSSTTTAVTATNSSAATTSKSLTDERNIDNLVLPKQEVIRRLRILKQPITLFGEDDDSRLDRLKYVLKAGLFEVDSDMTEGQTNDFLRDIAELRKQKDMKRMKANFEELCEEDKILVFFKKLLNEWKQELNEMQDAEKRTAKGKSMVATFKQCARYLHPLFKFCRKKVLPDDIRQALMLFVNCCMRRDYLAAMDHYIKLAIGNAPWPIGVTMVGIHERSAREKIYTNSVAHIMNDETTRKYLQSVKRLMTFCQRRYPTMPSKAVEFNSLANGSDLQSLLAEEGISWGSSSSQAGEERLRLMPAQKES
uniref:Pre-mRNA-splicing factor 18 n=1 Tax=Cannabis sativa TaxID=3483 RepID=A0A803NRI9_CANSA